jgi:hypothetical protein
MQNVVPFPVRVPELEPPVDLAQIRENVEAVPAACLSREARRAQVRATVAAKRSDEDEAARWLYFAAFCLSRLARLGPVEELSSCNTKSCGSRLVLPQ